jgi:hypothetical protein
MISFDPLISFFSYSFSQTALHYACWKCQVEVVQALFTRDDLQLNVQDYVRTSIFSLFIKEKSLTLSSGRCK